MLSAQCSSYLLPPAIASPRSKMGQKIKRIRELGTLGAFEVLCNAEFIKKSFNKFTSQYCL